jgi:rare lipoprotein A
MKKQFAMGCAIVGLIALSPKSEARAPEVHFSPLPATVELPRGEVGMASWYGIDRQGEPTASGELFDNDSFTAAHPNLPFGTKVRVTNLKNLESTLLRINDRGPGVTGRVLDVSTAAARRLGFLESGLARIEVDVVSYPEICARRIASSPTPDLN